MPDLSPSEVNEVVQFYSRESGNHSGCPHAPPSQGDEDISGDRIKALIQLGELFGDARVNNTFVRFFKPIPAGYTYLGQFIDHDLFFSDNSCKGIGRDVTCVESNDHHSMRSDELLLDGIYASDTVKSCSKTGKLFYKSAPNEPPNTTGKLIDAPQDDTSGLPLIADQRNSENLIIFQIHMQFIGLHNAFCDDLITIDDALPADEIYETAKRACQMAYAQVIKHDFLRKLLHPTAYDLVFHHDFQLETFKDESDVLGVSMHAMMSKALFRFGHSMVRDNYFLNNDMGDVDTPEIFQFSARHFGSNAKQITEQHLIDWSLFFNEPSDTDTLRNSAPATRNVANTVFPALVFDVPSESGVNSKLAIRNLVRGETEHLPSFNKVLAAVLNDIKTAKDSNELSADAKQALEKMHAQYKFAMTADGRLPTMLNLLIQRGRPRTPKPFLLQNVDKHTRQSVLSDCPLWLGMLCENYWLQHQNIMSGNRRESVLHAGLGPVISLIVAQYFLRRFTTFGEQAVNEEVHQRINHLNIAQFTTFKSLLDKVKTSQRTQV